MRVTTPRGDQDLRLSELMNFLGTYELEDDERQEEEDNRECNDSRQRKQDRPQHDPSYLWFVECA